MRPADLSRPDPRTEPEPGVATVDEHGREPVPEPDRTPEVEPAPELAAEPDRVPEPAPDRTFDAEPEPEAETELVVEPEPVEPQPDDDLGAALFGSDAVERFRGRWRELQADFVDDPARAVRGADELVGEVMTALSEAVTEHRHSLGEGGHDGAGETEELRVALRRYRSLFDQLLKT